MKLITLATITLTSLAPVTHAAESKAEQLQVLEDARNVIKMHGLEESYHSTRAKLTQ